MTQHKPIQPIPLESLPLSELSQWLNDNMLPDARTFLLPGTVNRTLVDELGNAQFVQTPIATRRILAIGSQTASVPVGTSFVTVPWDATLPNLSTVYPWYSIEPLGAAHSISASEIGSFTTTSVTVGLTSTVAQNVGVYAFAIGAN